MSDHSLRFKLFKNIGSVSLITYLSKIATIITGIVLARLLDPSDFGIYGLAMSIMAFVLIFNEMGLGAAVIQKKTEYDEVVFYTGFFIKSALSVILFVVILLFIAPWGARFYGNPDVKNITIFLAIIILIDNLKFIPRTRIIKSNNLSKLLAPSIINSISYSISVVLFAFGGFRYWSFVYAKLISSILGIVAFLLVMPWKPRLFFNSQVGKELISFGKFLVISSFLRMACKQMDNLIVGKLLGLSALGYYAMAYHWGNMFPLDVGKIVNQVLYPVNVKYQDNIPMLEKIQEQSLKYVSLIIIPISFGFAIVCPEFVNIVLGEKWLPAVIPLQIMAIHGLFWGLSKRGSLFVALGKPKYISFQALLFILLLAISIFPLTASMGISGTAIAVLISIIVSSAAFWVILHKVWNFRVKRILSQLVIPFVSSLIMLAVTYSVKTLLYNLEYSQLAVGILSVVVGIVTYSLCIVLFMYADVRKVVGVCVTRHITMRDKFRTILTSL